MNKSRIPFDLPYVQYRNTNTGEVLDFLSLTGSYITSKDELWLYPNTTAAQQVFYGSYIVQFHPVVFRIFSEAEFVQIFEKVIEDDEPDK